MQLHPQQDLGDMKYAERFLYFLSIEKGKFKQLQESGFDAVKHIPALYNSGILESLLSI